MKIVAMTIGPIGDTMALAKSPAMLWYSSAVFSRLAFLLCRGLHHTFPEGKLLTPCIAPAKLDTNEFEPDGVGKYHDRVVCAVPDSPDLKYLVSGLVTAAKQELAAMISRDKNGTESPTDLAFLMTYLQVHYVILPEAEAGYNPILGTSEYLDALEQMRCFDPVNTDNPFVALFGKIQLRNHEIRNCAMLRGVQNSQLRNADGSFRSISQIAAPDQTSMDKSTHYYAVIQADGDRMGEYLLGLTDYEQIQAFSRNCLAFSAQAAKTLGDFGGMTIYAGGDDLLALAPVLGRNGKTILDLCAQLQSDFNTMIRKDGAVPTISMGVSIRYEKFPLHEARTAAEAALFGLAKHSHEGKSYLAIDWQKHSGQGAAISIPMERLPFVQSMIDAQANQETVNSMIYNLDTFQALLAAQKGDPAVMETLFTNLYDNGGQAKYLPYVRELAHQFSDLEAEKERPIQVFGCDGDPDLKAFETLLRFKKFLLEEKNGRTAP